MPSIGFGEIVVILILALIIFGPRRLPEMGRTLGKSLREFRRATSDLRAELSEGLDEEPPRVPHRSMRSDDEPEVPEDDGPPAGADGRAGSAPPRGEAPPT